MNNQILDVTLSICFKPVSFHLRGKITVRKTEIMKNSTSLSEFPFLLFVFFAIPHLTFLALLCHTNHDRLALIGALLVFTRSTYDFVSFFRSFFLFPRKFVCTCLYHCLKTLPADSCFDHLISPEFFHYIRIKRRWVCKYRRWCDTVLVFVNERCQGAFSWNYLQWENSHGDHDSGWEVEVLYRS